MERAAFSKPDETLGFCLAFPSPSKNMLPHAPFLIFDLNFPSPNKENNSRTKLFNFLDKRLNIKKSPFFVFLLNTESGFLQIICINFFRKLINTKLFKTFDCVGF